MYIFEINPLSVSSFAIIFSHSEEHPSILEIKAKINKCDLVKLKSFCTTRETISKVKRQPSEWEKIIANEATERGGAKMAEDYTRETTFSPTNSLKEQLNTEQISEYNF